MDSPLPHSIALHQLPSPLVAALVEQGLIPPAYQLSTVMSAVEDLTALRLVLAAATPDLAAQLTQWRQSGLQAPVLVLGRGGDDLEVTETLALPLRLGALLARMRTYLILAQEQSQSVVSWGDYAIDVAENRLRHGTASQALTEKETALLILLAETGQAWERDDLLREIWGYESGIDTHTLETHIYRLRRKLATIGGQGDIVTTAAGYKLI